jgi:hypothetical protein
MMHLLIAFQPRDAYVAVCTQTGDCRVVVHEQAPLLCHVAVACRTAHLLATPSVQDPHAAAAYVHSGS